ncbi:hypothetical protein K474DRAFT_1678688 [Panus rudis PR-1116 ss-1]|nr:hypothetical protein K474DRAFT_1678688 [Panus rudis PR-1116 ss-1]
MVSGPFSGTYLIANFEAEGRERNIGAGAPPGSVGAEFVVALPPGTRAEEWSLVRLEDGKYRISRGRDGIPVGVLDDNSVGWTVTPSFPGEQWIINPRVDHGRLVYSIETSNPTGKAWTVGEVPNQSGQEKVTCPVFYVIAPTETKLEIRSLWNQSVLLASSLASSLSSCQSIKTERT